MGAGWLATPSGPAAFKPPLPMIVARGPMAFLHGAAPAGVSAAAPFEPLWGRKL